ncbi:MAG: transglycosylase SLT domain-containing protein, partial [Burkholderiaceae bacterium]
MTVLPQRRSALLAAALVLSLVLTGCSTLQQSGVEPHQGWPGSQNASADSPKTSAGQAGQLGQAPSAAGAVSDRSVSVPVEQTRSAMAVPAKPANIMLRVQRGFAMPELPSKLVDTHIKRFLNKPEYLERVFDRGGRYLHHIVEEVEARGLPTELALLPIVESAFNPQATSSAKAAGLWQFIPSTGRVFNLSQNWWMDERRDIIESTRAALDYLQKIYAQQGNDWFLALASYNWGEGAVSRAIKRNKARKKPTDYLSLKMPKETRHYVPQLIALRNLLRDPE